MELSADFVNYVDQSTAHSMAVVAVLTDMATAALKIWERVKDQQTNDRQVVVADLESHAKWQSWTELTTSPTKFDTRFKPDAIAFMVENKTDKEFGSSREALLSVNWNR